MAPVIVLFVADQNVLTRARRRRAATMTGLFALVAGFAWLLAAVPPFVGFGLAVTSAVAWCIWLEKHPEAQDDCGPVIHAALFHPRRSNLRSKSQTARASASPETTAPMTR